FRLACHQLLASPAERDSSCSHVPKLISCAANREPHTPFRHFPTSPYHFPWCSPPCS
ncbi:unnamed protein product, partial [Closterium sp. Yama58-4]